MGILLRTCFAFTIAFYVLQGANGSSPALADLSEAVGDLLKVEFAHDAPSDCAKRFMGRPGHRTIESVCA
jgi:hypothetical protein